MAFQLSEDLAQVLGLKDDLFLSLVPLWVEHHSIPLEHALPDHLSDIEYRRAHFNDLTDNFEEDVDIEYRPLVLTHFVVRYLPRLVETILLLPPVSLMYSPWFALLHFIGIRNPILASFMRTHKDRHALLAHLFKSLADATPSPKSFREVRLELSCLLDNLFLV
ncbi:hypothetical protein BDY24DRAFT_129336 [Mrakia frigida]|uniref:uncharacterized protein n=1 Tax=Mrakia frigida TaxID=29902 RepID=UPI003FCBFA5E